MQTSRDIIVGTASTVNIAASAIAQYTADDPVVTTDPDASEHSLLQKFQAMDAPPPQIVMTEDAHAAPGSKRARAHVFLYAVSFASPPTPAENETEQSAEPMEEND